MMSMDDAVRKLRSDPSLSELVRDTYLGPDVFESAERFAASGEFAEVCRWLGDRLRHGVVMDLGAGSGLSSWAFIAAGASTVYAVEPDPSDEVGRGALARIARGLPIRILAAVGEGLPLKDEQIDVAYTRQVLHHTKDLVRVLGECARVLKPGGLFLATREHVVDDEDQLREFLANHPLHRLVGGENAFPLSEYLHALESAGLRLSRLLGPWDSVINAYPEVRTAEELERFPRTVLEHRFGRAGRLLDRVPGVRQLVWKKLQRPTPGRMYSFLAVKPR